MARGADTLADCSSAGAAAWVGDNAVRRTGLPMSLSPERAGLDSVNGDDSEKSCCCSCSSSDESNSVCSLSSAAGSLSDPLPSSAPVAARSSCSSDGSPPADESVITVALEWASAVLGDENEAWLISGCGL